VVGTPPDTVYGPSETTTTSGGSRLYKQRPQTPFKGETLLISGHPKETPTKTYPKPPPQDKPQSVFFTPTTSHPPTDHQPLTTTVTSHTASMSDISGTLQFTQRTGEPSSQDSLHNSQAPPSNQQALGPRPSAPTGKKSSHPPLILPSLPPGVAPTPTNTPAASAEPPASSQSAPAGNKKTVDVQALAALKKKC
jgi:hypothetical protein